MMSRYSPFLFFSYQKVQFLSAEFLSIGTQRNDKVRCLTHTHTHASIQKYVHTYMLIHTRTHTHTRTRTGTQGCIRKGVRQRNNEHT